jgi:hypothetical protein
MHGDADALAGAQTRGVALAPILATAPRMHEMGVDLDEWLATRQGLGRHCRLIPRREA